MSFRALRFPLILLLSLLLWAPAVGPMLTGSDVAAGILRYLAALGLSWIGVGGILRLLEHYARVNEDDAERTGALSADQVAEGLAKAGESFGDVLSDAEAA